MSHSEVSYQSISGDHTRIDDILSCILSGRAAMAELLASRVDLVCSSMRASAWGTVNHDDPPLAFLNRAALRSE